MVPDTRRSPTLGDVLDSRRRRLCRPSGGDRALPGLSGRRVTAFAVLFVHGRGVLGNRACWRPSPRQRAGSSGESSGSTGAISCPPQKACVARSTPRCAGPPATGVTIRWTRSCCSTPTKGSRLWTTGFGSNCSQAPRQRGDGARRPAAARSWLARRSGVAGAAPGHRLAQPDTGGRTRSPSPLRRGRGHAPASAGSQLRPSARPVAAGRSGGPARQHRPGRRLSRPGGDLVRRFLGTVPDLEQRQALVACALARVTTEPLLRAALDAADVRDAFDWLRDLSFVEAGPDGLFPRSRPGRHRSGSSLARSRELSAHLPAGPGSPPGPSAQLGGE